MGNADAVMLQYDELRQSAVIGRCWSSIPAASGCRSSGHARFLLPWAEYEIVTNRNGLLSVDLRRVYYSLDRVKQAARDSQKPDWNQWCDDWVEAVH